MNELIKTFKGYSGAVIVLAFSPNGETLASLGGLYGKIKLWDVKNGNLNITFKGGHLGSGSFDPPPAPIDTTKAP